MENRKRFFGFRQNVFVAGLVSFFMPTNIISFRFIQDAVGRIN
jgi:hypothetical protein